MWALRSQACRQIENLSYFGCVKVGQDCILSASQGMIRLWALRSQVCRQIENPSYFGCVKVGQDCILSASQGMIRLWALRSQVCRQIEKSVLLWVCEGRTGLDPVGLPRNDQAVGTAFPSLPTD